MIKILYSIDRNSILDLRYSLISLKKIHKKDDIEIYILNDSFTQREIKKIEKINYNWSFNFIDFNSIEKLSQLNRAEIGWKLSLAAYAPLFLKDLLIVDKILYLDADTIIRKKLNTLWNLNLFDNVLAGVVEPITFDSNKYRFLTKGSAKKRGWNIVKHFESIEMNQDEYKNYINTGVLLIDPSKFVNYEDDFVSFHNTHLSRLHNDQDIINAVLKNKILNIDYMYNYFATTSPYDNFVSNSSKKYKKSAKNATVIHLAGTTKIRFSKTFFGSTCPIKITALKLMIWEKLI